MPQSEDTFTQADYEKVRDHTVTYRDRLLVMTLRATGGRITEILSLTPSHFREEGISYYLNLRRLKKRKDTWARIWISTSLGAQLREYIRGNNIGVDQPIFTIGRRMALIVTERAGRAALGRPVTTRDFRKLYVSYQLFVLNRPIGEVSKAVGHSNEATTWGPYAQVPDDVAKVVAEGTPV